MVHRRHSIRLPGYDYATENAYFVTICSFQRERIFGQIRNGVVVLSPVGQMVSERLAASSKLAEETELDAWVIMPNHVHFIVWFVGAHAMRPSPLGLVPWIGRNGGRVAHAPTAGTTIAIVFCRTVQVCGDISVPYLERSTWDFVMAEKLLRANYSNGAGAGGGA